MDYSYALLFLLPFVGGFIAMQVSSVNKNLLKLFLAFSGAFLFSVSIVDILPTLYQKNTQINSGVFILAGFFFQIILEYFTKGIEHGHLHSHGRRNQFPTAIVIGLCVHSFIEGIPLSNIGFLSEAQRVHLIYGVALHEAPAAFTLITLLRHNHISRSTSYIIMVLYSCMSLFGISLSSISTGMTFFDSGVLQNILALVIGTFLHISTTILFENSENHSFGRFKLMAIAIGVGLALLI